MKDINLGRIILATVAITLFDAVVGAVTCGKYFTWVYRIEPVNVWKPMEGPPGVVYYVGALVLTLVFVLVYVMLRKGIPGNNRLVRGLLFGLCVWAVGMLPGMFASYTFTTIAPTVILYWTLMGLVQQPLNGLIAAAIYGE